MLTIFGFQIHLFCHNELPSLLAALPVLGIGVARIRAWLAPRRCPCTDDNPAVERDP
ncbi:MAG TPA: hypothetical protein VMK12_08875 [Anaeromyxobacteraceae bacterium]|nr:hypothetical protein [Anaeromyxobacteraceae bacterium]